MNSSLYKDITVGRGLKYHYYFSPPAAGKPVLLFLHGFPSNSLDWARQIAFLQPMGYGIVAPDLLGIGGTEKPLDHTQYRLNNMSADVFDILAAEGLVTVVGIGHDWGSVLLSRLCVLRPEVFQAFVFIAVPFMPPITVKFDIEAAMAHAKATRGVETYAYWQFFCNPDAAYKILEHPDSFAQVVYPDDPESLGTYLLTRGKLRECVENNVQLGRASWLSEEEYNTMREVNIIKSVRSSLLWYVSQVQGNDLADSQSIPQEKVKVLSPALMIVALRDRVCGPDLARDHMQKFAGAPVDYVEIDGGHWVFLDHTTETNDAMLKWLEKLSV